MNVRWIVELLDDERAELRDFLSGGSAQVQKVKRAQMLLSADAGTSDDEIATNVGVGVSTVYRTKQRFVEGGRERALNDEPRPGAARKLSGKEEALLIATACISARFRGQTLDCRTWFGTGDESVLPRSTRHTCAFFVFEDKRPLE